MSDTSEQSSPSEVSAGTPTSCCSEHTSQRKAADNPHRTCRGWQKTEGAGPAARLRLGLIFGVILLLYVGLSLRLVQIQIVQGPKWTKEKEKQQVFCESSQAQRGPICDNNDLPLAFCLPRDTVIADLKILANSSDAAE